MTCAIDLISSSFSTEHCNDYSLSIREFPNGFSFSVTELSSKRCIAIKHVPNKTFKQIVQDEPLLQLKFRTIQLVANAPFALVPNAIFEAKEAKEYLPLERFKKGRAIVKWNKTPYECYCTFDIRRFPLYKSEVNYVHPLTALLQLAIKQEKNSFMLIELVSGYIHMVVLKEGKLLIANSFETDNSDDSAYYIMSVYQQLELNQEQFPILIVGDKALKQNPTELLTLYIRDINSVKPDAEWDIEFNKNDYSHFATLIESYLCES